MVQSTWTGPPIACPCLLGTHLTGHLSNFANFASLAPFAWSTRKIQEMCLYNISINRAFGTKFQSLTNSFKKR